MALSRTDLLGVIDPTPNGVHGTSDFTSASFTPPSSSLLVVAGGYIESNGTTTDPTSAFAISGGSLTWTQRVTQVVAPTAFPTLTKIWTAPVSSGSSMTVTLTAAGRTAGFYAVSAVAYTGYDTSTPVGATGSSSDATFTSGATALPGSLTLSGAPTSTSEVFAAATVSRDTAGVSPGSTFTEVHDVFQATYGGMETQARTGSTSTTVDWVDLRAGGNYFNSTLVAIEIKAAAPPWASFGYDVRIG